MTAGMRRRTAPGDSGAAAVEFALILPVLALLTFGLINFGWWFGQYLSLNSAVREGARRAVVENAATAAAVEGWVTAAAGSMIDPASMSFVPAPGTCSTVGDDLTVTVDYDTEWLVPNFLGIEAPNIVARSVFRCEVN